MSLSQVTYNGWKFPDRSNFRCEESFIYDEAGITVIATRFSLNVQTIVCVENVSPGVSFDSPDYDCGNEMHLLRQRLSKPGQALLIEHDGFGPRIEVNGAYSGIKDIAWGPKPLTISWEPVGHTRSVEVSWQCEFAVPICDGRTSSPSFRGLAALNYSTSFSYDSRGYTTRRISGYLEIAQTRISATSRGIGDSADNYRDKLAIKKPANFERQVSWDVSADKRRAMFSITDQEISSPNAWPPGVVKIQGTHRVGWNRSNLTRVANTISVSIEMAPDQLKSRAWLIFRDIVATRHQYAPQITGETAQLMIESLDIVEELYENKVSFQMGYTYLGVVDLSKIFATTGLFQPIAKLNEPAPTWETWDESIKHLTPLRGNGTDRGIANLRHEYQYDKIIDLCDNIPVGTPNQPPARLPQPAVNAPVLSNRQPKPVGSWLVYDASLGYYNSGNSFASITLGPPDTTTGRFNPADPTTTGARLDAPIVNPNRTLRDFVDEKGSPEWLVYSGYAERIGYPVPKPGEMKFGGVWMKPTKIANPTSVMASKPAFFEQKFLGMHFGVPKYAAAWRTYYRLSRTSRPTIMAPQFEADQTKFDAEPPA